VTRRSTPRRGIAAPGRERRIEHDGAVWRVWEARAGDYDRRGGTHLFFESEHAVRRVRDFPPDWFDLPDQALMDISRRR
jgi:hypothetical protein